MKLSELKTGDKITHYQCGQLIEGTVIETNGKVVTTEHDPVRWGRDIFTKNFITKSSYLQKTYGGRDKDGNPGPGPDVTPAAFYKGKPITI